MFQEMDAKHATHVHTHTHTQILPRAHIHRHIYYVHMPDVKCYRSVNTHRPDVLEEIDAEHAEQEEGDGHDEEGIDNWHECRAYCRNCEIQG